MLVEACDVPEKDALDVAADIRCRAEAAAHLDQQTLETLAAPFFEEALDHEPVNSPVWMKAITTLVIRNSALEDLHTSGPVNSGGIKAITTYGGAPLSHLIAARRRTPLPLESVSDMFASLPAMYPRAWACLDALRTNLIDGGGRTGYTLPQAPMPDLPGPEEVVQAPVAGGVEVPSDHFEVVVFSAIDPRLDHTALVYMHNAMHDDDLILGVSALSRISRNVDKLLRVLEFLLAYRARIITTNHLLTPREVWTRQRDLVKPNSTRPIEGFQQLSGLNGAHRKILQTYLKLMNETPNAS